MHGMTPSHQAYVVISDEEPDPEPTVKRPKRTKDSQDPTRYWDGVTKLTPSIHLTASEARRETISFKQIIDRVPCTLERKRS